MIAFVLGVRPHYVKAAALRVLLEADSVPHCFVDLQQHCDDPMRNAILNEYQTPVVELRSALPPCNRAARFASDVSLLTNFLLQSPIVTAVAALGDADPAFVAATVANRAQVPLLHIEAGVRRTFREPEHWNSLIADHLAEARFCYSRSEVEQLGSEGLSENTYLSGDYAAAWLRASVDSVDLERSDHVLVTIHRPQNCTPELIDAVADAACNFGNVIWVTHPRNRPLVRDRVNGRASLELLEPQPHGEMVRLIAQARVVLTDSGGLVREAVLLHQNVVVVHETGMWTGLVASGRVARADRTRTSIEAALKLAIESERVADDFTVDQGPEILVAELRRFAEGGGS